MLFTPRSPFFFRKDMESKAGWVHGHVALPHGAGEIDRELQTRLAGDFAHVDLHTIGERIFARVGADHFRVGERVLGIIHQRDVLDVTRECVGALALPRHEFQRAVEPLPRLPLLRRLLISGGGEHSREVRVARRGVRRRTDPTAVSEPQRELIHRRSLRARASASPSR